MLNVQEEKNINSRILVLKQEGQDYANSILKDTKSWLEECKEMNPNDSVRLNKRLIDSYY